MILGKQSECRRSNLFQPTLTDKTMKKCNAVIVLLALIMFADFSASAQSRSLEHLKKFPDCFSIAAPNEPDLEKINRLLANPPCFRQCLITNTYEYFLLMIYPAVMQEQLQQCYFSQKIIKGAMQMYNSENTLPMRRINDDLVSLQDSPLIPDYLKFPFPRPTTACKYKSIGDITKGNLIIYCTFHGAPGKTIAR